MAHDCLCQVDDDLSQCMRSVCSEAQELVRRAEAVAWNLAAKCGDWLRAPVERGLRESLQKLRREAQMVRTQYIGLLSQVRHRNR